MNLSQTEWKKIINNNFKETLIYDLNNSMSAAQNINLGNVISDTQLGLYGAGAKTIYYVEGNAGDDDNDGLTWETAFKTLAVALAASHADIASGSTGWASRNVIYLKHLVEI